MKSLKYTTYPKNETRISKMIGMSSFDVRDLSKTAASTVKGAGVSAIRKAEKRSFCEGTFSS